MAEVHDRVIIPWYYSVIAHPERPPIPDDPNARHLFQLAKMNRTADTYLTEAELDNIFTKFDIDGTENFNYNLIQQFKGKRIIQSDNSVRVYQYIQCQHC
ncbi:hypothetical protein CHS0354_007432 [Potamilus streckersoni]|uniref:Uncharacterized protein n=1 Tax=Potamilus streckersoni TaxID=2493646 RepID=A0AAE0SVJ8_9BIVA|nr:hypothetical protein CHS0354_007432 [Potamilus streckersoni]